MPFYRFHIEVPSPPEVVRERLAFMVRPEPALQEYFSRVWSWGKPMGPPFIGDLGQDSFTLRRDIRYRNSFLPQIKGQITPSQTGTLVNVTMFLHPFVAIFMAFWLSMVGFMAVHALPGVVMFLAGTAIAVGGFFSEAFKAKRILMENLLNPNRDS